MSSPTYDQTLQFLQVLVGGGLTYAAILSSLTTQFPEAGWDAPTVLSVGNVSVTEGRAVKMVEEAGGEYAGFAIDMKMTLNDPKNRIWRDHANLRKYIPLLVRPVYWG